MNRLKPYIDAFKAFYLGAMPYSLIVTLAIGLILAVVLFFGYLFHQTDSKNEKKAEDANANVIKTETNANVQSDQTEILKQNDQKTAKDTKEVEKRTKDARANYNSAVRRDSNSYGADKRAIDERFCRQFPGDSSCLPATQ